MFGAPGDNARIFSLLKSCIRGWQIKGLIIFLMHKSSFYTQRKQPLVGPAKELPSLHITIKTHLVTIKDIASVVTRK